MTTTQIVWNGCDGYIDIDNGAVADYDITRHADGSATLHTSRESFKSFSVVEIDKATVPIDEDGEMIFDGLFMTEDFRVFREA